MSKRDNIKASALNKLDEYIIGELQYLEDNNLNLSDFSLENMLTNYLSSEEKKEIASILNQLKENIVFFCKYRSIDIPHKLLLRQN